MKVVRTSWVVIRFVIFLWQPCNKVQGRCTVKRHLQAKYVNASSVVSRPNALRVLQQPYLAAVFVSVDLQQPCLAAVLRPHKIDKRIAMKINMSNI